MIGARSLALSLVGAVGITTLSAGRPAAQSGDAAIVSLLESIRQEQRLPALGAAVVTSRGVLVSGVTGVRKAGATPLATIDDLWHLGSNTKAMTAGARRGKLRRVTAIHASRHGELRIRWRRNTWNHRSTMAARGEWPAHAAQRADRRQPTCDRAGRDGSLLDCQLVQVHRGPSPWRARRACASQG